MCYEINCVLKTNTVESLETLKCLTVLLKPVQHWGSRTVLKIQWLSGFDWWIKPVTTSCGKTLNLKNEEDTIYKHKSGF